MSIITTSAGSDSRGKSGWEGGEPLGDQTGNEFHAVVYDGNYWNDPKTCVLRCKNADIQNAYRIRHKQMANNDCYGYDQSKRMTGLAALRKTKNFDPSLTTEKCAVDCSSSVSACVLVTLESQGIKSCITGAETTSSMRSVYINSGWFDDVTKSVNLKTGAGLKNGDILVKQGSHTVTVWDIGTTAKSSTSKPKTGTTSTALYMREKPIDGRIILVIPKGATVTIGGEVKASTGTIWYKVTYHGASGYSSSKYIK